MQKFQWLHVIIWSNFVREKALGRTENKSSKILFPDIHCHTFYLHFSFLDGSMIDTQIHIRVHADSVCIVNWILFSIYVMMLFWVALLIFHHKYFTP